MKELGIRVWRVYHSIYVCHSQHHGEQQGKSCQKANHERQNSEEDQFFAQNLNYERLHDHRDTSFRMIHFFCDMYYRICANKWIPSQGLSLGS